MFEQFLWRTIFIRLNNFFLQNFHGIKPAVLTLKRYQMALIFFDLYIVGRFVNPDIIVNRKNILFCFHAFIEMNVFFVLTEQTHLPSVFRIDSWRITQLAKLEIQFRWVIKLKNQGGHITNKSGYCNREEQTDEKPKTHFCEFLVAI